MASLTLALSHSVTHFFDAFQAFAVVGFLLGLVVVLGILLLKEYAQPQPSNRSGL